MGFIISEDPDHGAYKVAALASLLIVMQVLSIVGRCISRKLQKSMLAVDDYMLLLATVFTCGLCVLAIVFPDIAGVGAHIEDIQKGNPSKGSLFGESFIVWTVLYGLAITTSKWAILLLYLRAFTNFNKKFLITTYVVGFVVGAVGVINTLNVVFQCSPINYAWNKSIQGGTCIDEVAFARYIAIPNVVTGIFMVVMPLPLVWKLNMTMQVKMAVTLTLFHGVIGTIASCARLIILFKPTYVTNANSTALTWTIWTINEPANYVIAGCLPCLRPIIARIFPDSFLFVLSKRRRSNSNRPYTSSIKVSWLSRSSLLLPKFLHLGSGKMAMASSSRITGPWNTIHGGEGEERDGHGSTACLDWRNMVAETAKDGIGLVTLTREMIGDVQHDGFDDGSTGARSLEEV